MEPQYFVNPYTKEATDKFYQKFLEHLRDEGKISERVFQQITVTSTDEKPYTLTLEQLKKMKLSPFFECAYFGRTSEEWDKALQQASNESWKMHLKLERTIATCYTPDSTRWHRNYTQRAQWYYLCRMEDWI